MKKIEKEISELIVAKKFREASRLAERDKKFQKIVSAFFREWAKSKMDIHLIRNDAFLLEELFSASKSPVANLAMLTEFDAAKLTKDAKKILKNAEEIRENRVNLRIKCAKPNWRTWSKLADFQAECEYTTENGYAKNLMVGNDHIWRASPVYKFKDYNKSIFSTNNENWRKTAKKLNKWLALARKVNAMKQFGKKYY